MSSHLAATTRLGGARKRPRLARTSSKPRSCSSWKAATQAPRSTTSRRRREWQWRPSTGDSADNLWTFNSFAIYHLLVLQRAWSPERYRDWIASTNARALLPGRRRPTPPSDRLPIHERRRD